MAIFKRDLTVTGLSQYSFDAIKHKIAVGEKVELIHDPKNRYDSCATGVFVRGEQIGWIKKSENALISEVLKYTPTGGRLYVARVATYRQGEPVWKSTLILSVEADVPKELYEDAQQDNWNPLIKDTERYMYQENDVYKEFAEPYQPKFEVNISEMDRDTAKKLANVIQTTTRKINPIKETIMTKIVDTNKQIATQAAFMEAGRVFLNQVTKFVAKQSPLMVKGYIDTPAGKLAIANATVLAVQHFRPNDARLNRLANAALGQAYQEMYQTFDIERFIEGFLNNETIKAALSAAGEPDVE